MVFCCFRNAFSHIRLFLFSSVDVRVGDETTHLSVMNHALVSNFSNKFLILLFLGHPKSKDIEDILEWMLNKDFTTAYRNVMRMKTEKGMALQDVLEEIHSFVHKIDFPTDIRIHLLEKMADIEDRLAAGTNENIQTGSLIAAFQQAKNMVAATV